MPLLTQDRTAIAPPRTREEFFDVLKEAGILEGERLQRVSDTINPLLRDPSLLAGELINKGLLTPFQTTRLLSGQTKGFVIGKYLILDHLVKKEAARVYKARHRSMNRDVCLVLVHAEQTRKPEVREYLDAEARRVATLFHPNVITLYDVGSVGQRVYLVEEFMAGAELSVLLMQQGRLGVSQSGHILRQAALGLQHAHEKGLIHGRLKPTAILVGAPRPNEPNTPMTVKVCGFGLSRLHDDTQNRGLEFLAPEQFYKPGHTSIAADIYALGCLYYTMLMGVPPYPSLSLYDAAKYHNETPPPDVRTLRPDLPPSHASLLERMLAKDPAQRPQSMAEIATALETCHYLDLDKNFIDFSLLHQMGGEFSQTTILSDTHTSLPAGATERPVPPVESQKLDREVFAINRSSASLLKQVCRRPRTPEDVSRMWFVLYGLIFLAIILAALVLIKRFLI